MSGAALVQDLSVLPSLEAFAAFSNSCSSVAILEQVAIEALKFKAVKALSEYVLFDASTKDERLKKRLFKAPPSPSAEN